METEPNVSPTRQNRPSPKHKFDDMSCPRCTNRIFPKELFSALSYGDANNSYLVEWQERGEEFCFACHTTDHEDPHHDCGRYSTSTVVGLAILMNQVDIVEALVRRTPLSVLTDLRVFLDVELLGKGGLEHVEDEVLGSNGYRHGILAAAEWVQTKESDLFRCIHNKVKAKARWKYIADLVAASMSSFLYMTSSESTSAKENKRLPGPRSVALPSKRRMDVLRSMR